MQSWLFEIRARMNRERLLEINSNVQNEYERSEEFLNIVAS